MTTNPTLTVSIPLSVTIAVNRNGKAEMLDKLTLKRPKTRHVKQLAVIVGPELLTALMSDGTAKSKDDVDIGKLVAEVAPALFSEQRLDAFLALVADLVDISADEAGEIDPLDFIKVLGGMASFFPALQSIGRSSSPPT